MSLVSNKVVESWAQLHRQDDKKVLSHLIGFVAVAHTGELGDVLSPCMVGLLAPGIANVVRIVNRRIVIDGKAPEWFKEAVNEEFHNPTGLQFRVRVAGWSKSGAYLYVTPLARSLRHALTEWKREIDLEHTVPKTVEACKSAEALAELAYRTKASELGWTIVQRNPQYDNVVVVEKDGRTLWYLSGALDIWNFNEGIIKGSTSFKDEVEIAVKLTKITA